MDKLTKKDIKDLRVCNKLLLNNKIVEIFDLPYLIDDDKEDYLINEVWIDEYQKIKLTTENIKQLGFNHLERFIKYPELFQCVHDSEGLFVKFRNLDIPLQIRFYHELQNIINDLKI